RSNSYRDILGLTRGGGGDGSLTALHRRFGWRRWKNWSDQSCRGSDGRVDGVLHQPESHGNSIRVGGGFHYRSRKRELSSN
uniref:Uncharacterized protein n=1 Tax=Oryza meridionalis TaxID=40149 RepID=A0A0E0DUE6_9ORYZ